ncbi:hypothetical protein L1887_11453 [Cichorium endivia]|nr:hypothetical protein L1887_11453 [Cichorium endivia]
MLLEHTGSSTLCLSSIRPIVLVPPAIPPTTPPLYSNAADLINFGIVETVAAIANGDIDNPNPKVEESISMDLDLKLKSNLVSIHTLEINETIKEDDGTNQKSTVVAKSLSSRDFHDDDGFANQRMFSLENATRDSCSQFALENYKVAITIFSR